MEINSIDFLFENQLFNCKLYLSDEYLSLQCSPNSHFEKARSWLLIRCGSGLIGIQIMSKSRCSSKRYDMIPWRSCLEVERFQNVCKANYPPYCFVFWRCWYNELLFTTKIFYFFDQDYLVKIHKDLTYSVRRPYVRKYDCQSRSWTILYKNLRNKRELWRLASMK